MTITAVAPWFGSNRMLAHRVGEELRGCKWAAVVFAGGMSEVAHIAARSINVNDIHRHVINLANVIGDRKLGPQLYRRLRRLIYHPDVLAKAQDRCRLREAAQGNDLFPEAEQIDLSDAVEWAQDYFVCAWMSRHGVAGTPAEFTGGMSIRWNANGGDSAKHFHGAARGLLAWRPVLQRCNFTTLDFRDFLAKCKDDDGHAIYSDAPFPDAGDGYTNPFTMKDQSDLATLLRGYRRARVVIRFYDHPVIRELYPESHWTWLRLRGGKKQTNEEAPEVLLINGKSYATTAA